MFGTGKLKARTPLKVGGHFGFTLIEILVVLAIIAVLGGSLIPFSLHYLNTKREDATRQEIRVVYEGIFGDPEKGYYGYVGDIGALPSSLDDLISKPVSVSDFAYYTNDVGYGWRGSYINTRFNDIKDGWDKAYDFGAVKTGQIRSAGPDRDFSTTDDNIVFPFVASGSGAVEIDGTLQITVYINNVPNPAGTTVQVYYATNGAENVTPLSDNTPADGFKFSTHHGIHAVKVTHVSSDTSPITTTKTVNAAITARRQTSLEIFLRTTGIVNP